MPRITIVSHNYDIKDILSVVDEVKQLIDDRFLESHSFEATAAVCSFLLGSVCQHLNMMPADKETRDGASERLAQAIEHCIDLGAKDIREFHRSSKNN
jgi:hypothetical protein